MSLPTGGEFAWFLCGMWAALFVLRVGRASESGFFSVVATLVLAVMPALALLFEAQLGQVGAAIRDVIQHR